MVVVGGAKFHSDHLNLPLFQSFSTLALTRHVIRKLEVFRCIKVAYASVTSILHVQIRLSISLTEHVVAHVINAKHIEK